VSYAVVTEASKRVRSERRRAPPSRICAASIVVACSGAAASGASPQPATLAGVGALPVTVTGASVFWARAWRERRSAAAEARASVERRVVKVM
jgi:hypothetical protein